MTSDTNSQAQRRRQINDKLRRDMPHGSVVLRGRAKQFSNDQLKAITQLIQTSDDFGPETDVDELHDQGAVEFEGIKIVWKIEAFGRGIELAPQGGNDEALSRDMLVIMLESDG